MDGEKNCKEVNCDHPHLDHQATCGCMNTEEFGHNIYCSIEEKSDCIYCKPGVTHCGPCKSDRDAWKRKAEKMAAALREIIWADGVARSREGPREGYARIDGIAQEALAEFREGSDWRDKVKDIMDKGNQAL